MWSNTRLGVRYSGTKVMTFGTSGVWEGLDTIRGYFCLAE